MGKHRKTRKEAKIMATQIAPTPIIKGRIAKSILVEVKNKPTSAASEGAKKIMALFETKK